MITIVAIAPEDFKPLAAVRAARPELRLFASDDVALLERELAGADVVVVAPRAGRLIRELWPHLAQVKWLHALSAGVEYLPFDLLRHAAMRVTSSRGLYAVPLSEFTIAAMLWFARDMTRLLRQQTEHTWQPFEIEQLEGAQVGVIGMGGIGSAIASRAKAFGMAVEGVTRSSSHARVDDVVRNSDYLVLAMPLTEATRGMMSRGRIFSMRRSAVLINVGRGATVDEEALVDALRQQRIRGAALDVFAEEPLRSNHPLWDFENVLISPHSADSTADSHERAILFFLDNLRRYEKGEPLLNEVDPVAGY